MPTCTMISMPTLYRNFRITQVITGESSLKGVIIFENKEMFWLYYLQW